MTAKKACSQCFGPCPARQTYCCRACRRAAVMLDRCCSQCSGNFQIYRSTLSGNTNSSGRFCSRSCYDLWLCRTGRVTGRGSQWGSARREAILRNPFCAICASVRRLEVHHIIPFRISRDNRQENLIPLCKVHHKIVEAAFLETEAHYDADALIVWRGILVDRQDAARIRLMEIIRDQAA